MNKEEAAKYLGCSVRSLERYTKKGDVKTGIPTRGKTGFVANYEPDELERFKAVLNSPPDKPVEARQEPPQGPTSQATTLAVSKRVEPSQLAVNADFTGFLAAFAEWAQSGDKARQSVPVEAKLLLSTAEAISYTGVSEATIKAAVRDGKLTAHKGLGRGHRFKRADLDSWVAKL